MVVPKAEDPIKPLNKLEVDKRTVESSLVLVTGTGRILRDVLLPPREEELRRWYPLVGVPGRLPANKLPCGVLCGILFGVLCGVLCGVPCGVPCGVAPNTTHEEDLLKEEGSTMNA